MVVILLGGSAENGGQKQHEQRESYCLVVLFRVEAKTQTLVVLLLDGIVQSGGQNTTRTVVVLLLGGSAENGGKNTNYGSPIAWWYCLEWRPKHKL